MLTVRKYIQNHRGQAMVEFALVLPVLLLLVCGMIEFGRIFHEAIVVTAAAREGARTAAVEEDDDAIIVAVKAAAPSIAPAELTIEITPAIRVRGEAVTVKVSHPVRILTPVISALFPQNPYPVVGTAVMRVE